MKAVPIKEKECEGNAPRREKRQRWARIKGSEGKEGKKRRQTHGRNGITVAGASDSAISGNDRKKGAFVCPYETNGGRAEREKE